RTGPSRPRGQCAGGAELIPAGDLRQENGSHDLLAQDAGGLARADSRRSATGEGPAVPGDVGEGSRVKVTLKKPQWTVFRNPRRFRVLAAGRRFGKTYLALTELCKAAWGPNRLAWYVAPTYRQAKRIAWKALRQMTKQYWATRPNESDLRIELISGG